MRHENFVKTFDKNKKELYSEVFTTSGKAYAAYKDMVKYLSSHLPKGYEVTIARYSDGMMMHCETIKGVI